ncbi:MAG: coenzyme F420-0:L-glutamate ligase [Caldisericia bacterium]|nr:coenzyme F420-0:L-glutamate ligase [Caldisericia bacterium]
MKKIISLIYQGYIYSFSRKGKDDILLEKLKRVNRNYFTPKIYEIFGNLLIKNGDFSLGEEILKEGIEKFKKGRGIYRTLSQLYLRKGEIDKAIEVIKKAKENNRETYWYNLVLGDLYYYEKKDLDSALKEYEELLKKENVPLNEDIKSPARYLFKRLSRIYFEKKEYEKAKEFYEKFYNLKPSNFYEKDFLYYGETLYNLGKIDDAIKIWKEGIQRRRGNIIKNGVKIYGIDLGEVEKIEIKDSALRIPIKTSLITERSDIFEEIREKTKGILKDGDIITIASAVAAIADGRVFSVETINPSIFAKVLSSFVSRNKNNPFATTAPLSNPYAMQIAIEEVGLLRILIASFFGFLGKIFKKRGIFYIIAGKIVTQIDDMPASMPPYDYYVISGVHDSKKFLNKVKEITGCEACIVDANDLGIAWVVDSTDGVDKNYVEKVLSDNPQGNEDFQTPIVIIRKNIE